jgi:signal transduction histidine kinase
MKLFPKLALLLSVVALVPIVVFAGLGIDRTARTLRERIAMEQAGRARQAAEIAATHVRAVLRALTSYAGYADLGAASGDVLTGVLRVAYRQSDDISIISLVDETGEAITDSVYLEDPEATDALRLHPPVTARDLELHGQHIPLEAALASGVAVGPPYGGRLRPRVALAVETPHQRDGHRLVLVAELCLDPLERSLFEMGRARREEIRLLAPDGSAIGMTREPMAIPGSTGGEVPSEPTTGSITLDGATYLAAFHPVPVLGWGVLVRQAEVEALTPIARLRRDTAYWAVVGVMLALLLAAFVARDLSQRIGDLDSQARALARGDLEKRVPVRGRDELGSLANSFNVMAGEIEVREREIEQKNREITEWNETLERRVAEKTDELARAQEVVLRARRLAGLGVLGAGVAHEINNPLTAALGFIQITLKDGDLPDRHRTSLQEASVAAIRIRGIVQELLKLADSRSGQPRGAVDLTDVVARAVHLADGAVAEKRVTMQVDLATDLPSIVGSAEQLTEILLHLIRNALSALEAGGTVAIRGRRVGDQLVTLEVEDDGKGIPPELVDRVFDPFFTTKDDWESRGLGLSVVHKIVEDHGGRLDLSSEVGRGTRVTITLPAAPGGRHLA